MATRAQAIAETDLSKPLQDYLTAQGYTVRCEVKHCDIVAVKDDALIIIELKRQMCLALLEQAVARQQLSDSVYVAIPRPANMSRWLVQSRGVRKVLRQLEVGLILVSPDAGKPAVEVVFHPLPAERRKRKRAQRAVLEEIEQRSGDYNRGGSCRRKLITAYRENAIHIATILADAGPLPPRALRSQGTGPKTLSILTRNVYGWFERIDRGVYGLTMKGRTELAAYPQLVAHFQKQCAHQDE
ncbi:MAG TPA: DUF2161 family putative PD-(D/E)XK-type phosphodiesterase [Armatimonadota bacterium]|nr:DUF2161 family putative PD-(D/E)XK-type phosphodiesterase [Armatimonadota bacterium]